LKTGKSFMGEMMEENSHAQPSLPFGFGHSSWEKEDSISQGRLVKTVDGMLTVRAALSMNYSCSYQPKNNAENRGSSCVNDLKDNHLTER
jgi:hypothetical protein